MRRPWIALGMMPAVLIARSANAQEASPEEPTPFSRGTPALALGDGRGSYTLSAAASLGIAAAGLPALEALHYDAPVAPIVLVAVPIAQLVTSVAIERATD